MKLWVCLSFNPALYPPKQLKVTMKNIKFLFFILPCFLILSCNEEATETSVSLDKTIAAFGDRLPLDPTYAYENQQTPPYITKDNSGTNTITNRGATLGRVLFYDKNLSADKSTSCASCHQQAHAFSDAAIQSQGMNGLTGRHSMRLINARFGEEVKFFWDERATSLEDQTTRPIQDHSEMGFSGENGDPSMNDLIIRLESIDYYEELFTWTYGDPSITEEKMQLALSQFIRSIQSFDSQYDEGRLQVNADNVNFPNFSTLENRGKQLFMAPPDRGGLGCAGCHRAPEFDIDPNSGNNGVVRIAGNLTVIDPTNTRAPSLRDIFNSDGQLNTPLMHDGSFNTMSDVIDHYTNIAQGIEGLDPRLNAPISLPSDEDKEALIAFIKTLSGKNVYTDPKWSDPFLQ